MHAYVRIRVKRVRTAVKIWLGKGHCGTLMMWEAFCMFWVALWDQFFFLRKTPFYEHGIAKIQLNSIIHASKWAQIGVSLVEFRRKSGVDDAWSLLGSFPNIIFFWKLFTFWAPNEIFSKSDAIQIPIGAHTKFRCFISRNIRRITRFHLRDRFLIFWGLPSESTLRWTPSIELPCFQDIPIFGYWPHMVPDF